MHCHDDLGLATANTLAGIQAGARQAEVTVNGIGERAGNTSLEEVVMALLTRRAVFGLETGIDTTQIARVSRHGRQLHRHPGLSPTRRLSGRMLLPTKRASTRTACSKTSMTYEIMRPETVGLNRSLLVLGKHSGRHALRVRLDELGYQLNDDEMNVAFERFKQLADKKKAITDADLEALIEDMVYQTNEVFSLDGLQVACGTMGMPTATVRLRDPEGNLRIQAAVGTGPVDATYKAVDAIVGRPERFAGIQRARGDRRDRCHRRGHRALDG